MSWITRCPDCDTVYKVESEQLQQAHGWLRCGTCQHVFDSAGRVVAADVIPTLTDRIHVGAPQLGRVDLERLLHKESPEPVAPLPAAPAAPDPEPVAEPPSPIAAFEEALQSFKLPDAPLPVSAPAATVEPDDSLQEEVPESEFEPAASASRSSLGVVARLTLGVLGLVLLLQALLALRPTLLMHWPQWGRVASQWCHSAACRAQWQPSLSLWSLKAQPLTIDGAGYRLAWSLSHSASVALSVPDLELRLFDAQGKTVSTQRLTGFMTSAPYVLDARQTWQGSLRVDLAPDLDARSAQLLLITR